MAAPTHWRANSRARLEGPPALRKGTTSLVASRWRCEAFLKLARVTYQFPDEIADGIRMVSSIELWNEIARHHGASAAQVHNDAAALRGELTQIVNRRNKIVHEGDLQPNIPRVAWPITRQDVDHVKRTIERVVSGIEAKI